MTVARDPDVLSVAEAAARLQISERYARDLIRDGQIPCLRFGRLIRVPVVQLDRLLAGDFKPEQAS